MNAPRKPWERATPSWLRQDKPAPPIAQRRAEPAGPTFQPVPSTDYLKRQGRELERLGRVSDLAHRLAYHEAAHVIIATALGMPVREVSIDVQRGTGETRRTGPDPTDVNRAMQLIVAGRVGEEMRFAGPATGAGPDDHEIAQLVRLAQPGALDQAKRNVRDMLNRWDILYDAMASALIRHRRLDRDDINAVIDGDVPYITRMIGRHPAERSRAGATFEVDYTSGTPRVIRDTLPWGTQPEADRLPNARMGPQLPTDPNDIDIVELIADLTAVVVSADAGEMGRQPALLAALQKAVTALQSVA